MTGIGLSFVPPQPAATPQVKSKAIWSQGSFIGSQRAVFGVVERLMRVAGCVAVTPV